MSDQLTSNKKIIYLRLEQVKERIGLSRASIYDKMDPDSPRHDPHFPRQVKIGPRSVAWVESQINAWLASRVYTNGEPVESVQPISKLKESKGSARRIPEKESGVSSDLDRKRITVVRELLEKHAKRGESLFYDDVMARAMLSPGDPADCEVIDRILDDISKAFHAEHNVLIGALVHEAYTGKRRPKKGFFDLAKFLGYTFDDPDMFINQQIIKLYELYEEPAAKSKGKLIWMQVHGKTFLTRK